jgi:hypothetical protein
MGQHLGRSRISMKPQRAFGIVTAMVLGACLAAGLTPQQNHPVATGAALDALAVPVVFSVR